MSSFNDAALEQGVISGRTLFNNGHYEYFEETVVELIDFFIHNKNLSKEQRTRLECVRCELITRINLISGKPSKADLLKLYKKLILTEGILNEIRQAKDN